VLEVQNLRKGFRMELKDALEQLRESSPDTFNLITAKLTELNEENKERRQKNKELSDFKNGLVEKFGLNSDDDLSSQLEGVIQSKEKKAQESMSDVEKLSLQMQELTSKFQDSEKRAQENAQKAILAKRDSELTSALSESNVPKELLPIVKDSLEKRTVVKDGNLIFTDGENTFNSIKEGVSSFIEKNPHLQAISNIPGSGEQNNGNEQVGGKIVSRDSFGSNLEAIARGDVVVR
jgi:DNA repair exonuclease SbcCD ATPase subunit